MKALALGFIASLFSLLPLAKQWPTPTVRSGDLVVIAECRADSTIIPYTHSLTVNGKRLLKVQRQCQEA